MSTIDDIIDACKNEKYGLNITDENRSMYHDFLTRHKELVKYKIKKAKPDADLNDKKTKEHIFYLLRDLTLTFAYLMGDLPITAGWKDDQEDHTKTKRIKSVKDLYLLRRSEIGFGREGKEAKRKTDQNLYALVGRCYGHRKRLGYGAWGDLIDEAGKDKYVVERYGKEITNQMVRESHSENELTFDHGGFRHFNKRKK